MKELNYKVPMDAWKDVKIIIKDEMLFKEKYKIFSNEEFDGEHLHYFFLDYDFFNIMIDLHVINQFYNKSIMIYFN